MNTYTYKLFGKTLFVYGFRPRVIKNRYGINRGSTFNALHFGKGSHYLSIPALAKRKFGGKQDIVNNY